MSLEVTVKQLHDLIHQKIDAKIELAKSRLEQVTFNLEGTIKSLEALKKDLPELSLKELHDTGAIVKLGIPPDIKVVE